MAKRKTFYAVGVLMGLSLLLTTLLSLAAPAPNISAAQSLTRTATATPENVQAVNALNSLVSDSNCVAPCWLGLQVGVSGWEELQNWATTNLGRPLLQGSEDGKYLTTGGLFRRAGIDNTLTAIWIDVESERIIAANLQVENPSESYIDWSPLMPAQILDSHKAPDEITLELEESAGYLYLTMRYYSIGLFVLYGIHYEYTSYELPLNICVNLNSINWMRMWIQSEPIELSLEMQNQFWERVFSRSPYEFDLEAVSDLDIPSFVETISDGIDCFEISSYEQLSKLTHHIIPIASPMATDLP
ncbi:MAG: hypothetical protein HY862_06020 [Chloroflexi bacterium]|nr:hypothetical protein [Chloroflexota bacterium]